MHDPEAQRRLLILARGALEDAVRGVAIAAPDAATLPAPLRDPGACFVTLTRQGALRGCIGSLAPQRPLWRDAMANAAGAALRDTRFAPVAPPELAGLLLAISVLTPQQPIEVADRAALIAALVPGQDGLVIEDGGRRATFLPKVWEQLPDPERFLAQLWHKAGLAPDHWSPTLRLARYGAVDFGE